MSIQTKSVGILGTGKYLPEKILTNRDLEKIVDTNDKWIRERTGIEERRIAEGDITTSFMATEAAKQALEAANVKPEEIGLVIVATLTGDMSIPSTACLVQANLGCTNAGAFDLGAACSGFAQGLITAQSYISTGICKYVLVIGAERLSTVLNWKDRNTCILFGDGAGAAVLGVVPDEYGIKGVNFGADGNGGKDLCIPSSGSACLPSDENREAGLTYVHMNGSEVYKFAVKRMGQNVLEALKQADMDVADLDYFIPHQANLRIIDSAAHKLKLPKEKVFVNLPKYGNTSGASIAIALDEVVRGNLIERGNIVAMSGFGAGLTWAGLVMKWY